MTNQPEKKNILIVDDNPLNIRLLVEGLKDDYSLSIATSGTEALSCINSLKNIDLILLDIIMPDMNGYEVLKKLKQDENTKDIPVIFITAKDDEEDEKEGFRLGAIDYIAKPFSLAIVKARIKNHLKLKDYQEKLEILVEERTKEVIKTQLEIVFRLSMAAEYKDDLTGRHIKRISHFCELLGTKYGFDKEKCELLFHASSMHDIGKIGIPDNVLLKPGKLTSDEWKIMQSHTTIGAELLVGHNSSILIMAHSIALSHHEKWDGSGYPKKLSGNDIPIEGRITAICDVFDALTSNRPYRKAWTTDRAIEEITDQRGKHFDPHLVDLFISIFPEILKIHKKLRD